jgi:hypothetical protein
LALSIDTSTWQSESLIRSAANTVSKGAKSLPAVPGTFQKKADSYQALNDEAAGLSEQYLISPVSDANIPSTIVQRFPDLVNEYENKNFPDKDEWIVKFREVQEILNDTALVNSAIEGLSNLMAVKGMNLSQALAWSEDKIWSPDQLMLTDFVPAPLFLKLLREGKTFEDLVGKTHGVQSHRIQWFIITFFLGPDETLTRYREAGNERWMHNGKSMWDRVVDATGNVDEMDFTQPDHLEAYINRQNEQKGTRNKLTSELHTLHEQQPELKGSISERYPQEAAFTGLLQDAILLHKQLILERKDAENTRRTAIDRELIELMNSVMDEKVINTTIIDGVQKTIEWTGWIATASSQLKIAPTYLMPTVGKKIA